MHIDAVVARRRRLSLTSLIDVIFLLLLFFMLSSTFTRYSDFELLVGGGSASATPEAPDVLIDIGESGWRINGAEMPKSDAPAELKQLEAAGAKSAVIIVRADTPSQALVSAVELLQRATKLTVSVARAR